MHRCRHTQHQGAVVPHLWLRRHFQLAHLGQERSRNDEVVHNRPRAAGCPHADAGAGACRAAWCPAVHYARAHVLAELQEQAAARVVLGVGAAPWCGCIPGLPVWFLCHACI